MGFGQISNKFFGTIVIYKPRLVTPLEVQFPNINIAAFKLNHTDKRLCCMYNCRKNRLCSLPAANMPLQSKMTLDDKRKNLQTLLKVSTAERLQKCLLDNIPEASVTQVDALLALMQPLASAASTKLHCVRCHKSFFEHANNPKACRIPH